MDRAAQGGADAGRDGGGAMALGAAVFSKVIMVRQVRKVMLKVEAGMDWKGAEVGPGSRCSRSYKI